MRSLAGARRTMFDSVAEAVQTLDFTQLETTAFLSRKFFRLGRFIRFPLALSRTKPQTPYISYSQRVQGAAAPIARPSPRRRLHVAARSIRRALDLGGMCHLLLLLLPPPPPPLTLTLTLSPQVYLFFDNVELFLIFAGNQLSKLKARECRRGRGRGRGRGQA